MTTPPSLCVISPHHRTFACSCAEVSCDFVATGVDDAAVRFIEWSWIHADGYDWMDPIMGVVVEVRHGTVARAVWVRASDTPRFEVLAASSISDE